MKKYKLVFESGVTETIEVGSLTINPHIGKIEIEDSEGNDIDDLYIKFEEVAAVIPL